MISTAKVSPATSLTVSDTPSSATDPFGAMKWESCAGERTVNRAMSVKSSRAITLARPSAWPATTCPPSSSPSLSGRSRLMCVPFCQTPAVVARSVSAAPSPADPEPGAGALLARRAHGHGDAAAGDRGADGDRVRIIAAGDLETDEALRARLDRNHLANVGHDAGKHLTPARISRPCPPRRFRDRWR